MASGVAGDDTPTFSIDAPGPSGSALVDEPDSEEEEDREGVVPIPGGERVSQEQIDAGAAAGEWNEAGVGGSGIAGAKRRAGPRGSLIEQDEE